MHYPALEMLIAGEWTDGSSGKSEPVICPADGSQIGTLPHASPADLDAALTSSRDGFNVWRRMTPHSRQAILEKAACLLEDRFEDISANLTREMGKPVGESRIELRVAIDLLRWYAEEGKRVYGRIIPSRIPNMQHEARKEPVGPVVAFVAWNFPATNVMRKVAGALAAGCSITIKPSEETPATAIAIATYLVLVPDPAWVLILIGLFAWGGQWIRHLRGLDITKPVTTVVCGFSVTFAQLIAGAAGPLLDVFYLNSGLGRQSIVANKALTQAIGCQSIQYFLCLGSTRRYHII